MHRTDKVSLTAIFALGSLCVVHCLQHTLKLNLDALADKVAKSSVTITSIVRLVYLNKGYAILTVDYIDISIWTNVEANTSIICGE